MKLPPSLAAKFQTWKQDGLLRGVVRNSSYLFSSNTLTAALSMLQGIFVTRLLGVEGLGVVTTVIAFTSNINRLLSFRMSEVMVKHFNQVKEAGQTEQAAATTRFIALVEAATSLVAYLVLLALSGWAARIFVKEPYAATLFAFYGLVLLSNLVYETSAGILQAHKRFDRLALVNVSQSLLTAGLITVIFLVKGSLLAVLAAYLAGKTLAGVSVAVLALRQLNRSLGSGWWKVPLSKVPDKRGLLAFMFNTNLNGTVSLVARDSAPLFLAALRPEAVAQTEVGYFKLALTVINLVMLPIEPFIWPTYAEITRTVIARQWAVTRRLLRRVSAIATLWTALAGGGIALFGWWLIPLVYGPGTQPAYPAVLLLLLGYGTANILHWNRPLLLALGKPGYPLVVAALAGLVEVILILWLVPGQGYLAQAALLSLYFILSVGITAWRGLKQIDRQAAAEPA